MSDGLFFLDIGFVLKIMQCFKTISSAVRRESGLKKTQVLVCWRSGFDWELSVNHLHISIQSSRSHAIMPINSCCSPTQNDLSFQQHLTLPRLCWNAGR